MTYDEMVQTLAILARQATATTSPPYALPTDFSNVLPNAIEYAEDRIYREMVFLATRAQDASLTFTPGSRNLSLNAATTVIIVPEGVSAIYPAGRIPALGRRIPFLNTTLDAIDLFWPTEATTKDPSTVDYLYWAMLDAQTIVVAPSMDAAYTAEITGLFMPARLSATNQNTYLSSQYPDVMLAASMIFITGYLRNFGAQADNPQMSQSWETQYGKLAASATLEEQRRRGQGVGWSQNAPTPLATPART